MSRGARRRTRPTAVSEVVPRLLDELGLGAAHRVMRIADCWAAVVGERAARHSWPVRLRGEVLEAEVDGSVWSQELRLRAPEILAGLRHALGDAAPAELWLRLGSGRVDSAT